MSDGDIVVIFVSASTSGREAGGTGNGTTPSTVRRRIVKRGAAYVEIDSEPLRETR